MPVYEYYCPDCDIKFEKLVPLSRAQEQPPCPNCGGGKAQKLLSTFASVRSSGNGVDASAPSAGFSGGGCASCSGGHCSTCH